MFLKIIELENPLPVQKCAEINHSMMKKEIKFVPARGTNYFFSIISRSFLLGKQTNKLEKPFASFGKRIDNRHVASFRFR